jgi:DNA-binding transcriptional LysR family regulator
MCINTQMPERFDWDDLQSFLAVARTGRLTAAARTLGIDHSTLGRRIAGLEQALAAKLFERAPTGYTLTAQGERLLASAEAMESVATNIVSELAGSRLRISGAVRVGAPDGFGSFFLAPRIGRLLDRHRDLELQLVAMPRVFSLSRREADIAISLTRPAEGRLHVRKLTDYELGIYASAEYLAAHGPIGERGQLGRHRFIAYIDDLIYTPELDYLPQISRDIRPAFRSASLVAQFRAVIAGGGIAVLPCFMADAQPGLVRVLPDEVKLTRHFWLLLHADMKDVARVRVTADFIADEVRAAGGAFLPRG